MPKVYTLNTANTYAVFDDNSDSEEAIMSAAEAPVATKVVTQTKTNFKEPNPSKKVESKPVIPNVEEKESEDPADGDKRRVRTDRRDKKRPTKEAGFDHKKLDRRSGTGRGREARKDGAGAHGWGNSHGKDMPSHVEDVDAAPAVVSDEPSVPSVVTYGAYASQQAEEAALEEKCITKNVDPTATVYTKGSVAHAVIKSATIANANASIAGKFEAGMTVPIAFNTGRVGNDRRERNPGNTERRGKDHHGRDTQRAKRTEKGHAWASNIQIDDSKTFPSL